MNITKAKTKTNLTTPQDTHPLSTFRNRGVQELGIFVYFVLSTLLNEASGINNWIQERAVAENDC